MYLIIFYDIIYLEDGVATMQSHRLASGVSATMHPSLLESTTTGFPFRPGWNTFSTEQKKLLQSTRANILVILWPCE